MTLNNLVQHHVNGIQNAPVLMNSSFPAIGLLNYAVNTNNGWLTCSFTRILSMPTQINYFNLANKYYILSAYGTTDIYGKNRLIFSIKKYLNLFLNSIKEI